MEILNTLYNLMSLVFVLGTIASMGLSLRARRMAHKTLSNSCRMMLVSGNCRATVDWLKPRCWTAWPKPTSATPP